jgi:translation elongation factor EF-G
VGEKSTEDDEGEDMEELAKSYSGLEGYTAVREQIRKNGFLVNESLPETRPADVGALEIWNNQMRGSAVAGFQMALRAGPICEEPVRGVLVVLEGVEVAVKQTSGSENEFKCTKPLSGGMVVAALRSGIRCALLYV